MFSAKAIMLSARPSKGDFPGLVLVTVIALVKILATALTLGWGGSGGIFAPCLVIGAFVGLSFHRFIATVWSVGDLGQ
jgi:CIC family chloride channel protein